MNKWKTKTDWSNDLAIANAELLLEQQELAQRDEEPALPIRCDSWDDNEDNGQTPVVLVQNPHDLIEPFLGPLLDDTVDHLADQVHAALRDLNGGDLMRVVVDTTYRLRSYPAVKKSDSAETVAGLGLWIWMIACRDYQYTGRPTSQQVADTVIAHWCKYDRDAEQTMESAIRRTLSWAARLEDLPNELQQTLSRLTARKQAAATRKTGLTSAEAMLAIVCYALRDDDGRCFFTTRDLAGRLSSTLGLSGLTRTPLVRARKFLCSAGVLTSLSQGSRSEHRATVYSFHVQHQLNTVCDPLAKIQPVQALSALRQLDDLRRSRLRPGPGAIRINNHLPNGSLDTCGGSVSGRGSVVTRGVSIGDSSARHWRKEDVLNSSAGREVEMLRDICGYVIDETRPDGQACPRCGGNDRFSLRPDRADASRKVLFCRGCDWKGADILQAIQDALDLPFPTACAVAGRYLHVPARICSGTPRNPQQWSIIPELAVTHGLRPESYKTIECEETLREFHAPEGYVMRNHVLRVTTYAAENGQLLPSAAVDYGTATPKLKKGLCQRGGSPGVYSPKGQTICVGDRIVITEGLKDALRFQELHPGIKWLGLPGSRLPGQQAAWKRLLQDCHVIYIPDGDEAGIRGAEATQQALAQAVASFQTVEISAEITSSDGDGIREVAQTECGRQRIAAALAGAAQAQRVPAAQRSFPALSHRFSYYEAG